MANSEIRVGRVSSVNYETGMLRVTYRDKDDSVTSEFPMVTNNDEYRMPQIGQDVVVMHMSNGSSRGAVIGSIWNKKYAPYEAGKDLYRKELSRKKDAAYIRYSDKTGEYLLKVANLHLNGVNRTILDGPKLEIGANISVLLQTEKLNVDVPKICVTAGDGDRVEIGVEADASINMQENCLEAVILKAALELVENLELKAGTDVKAEAGENMELSAEASLRLSGGEQTEILAGDSLVLSDGTYHVTLKEIMERLEALEV